MEIVSFHTGLHQDAARCKLISKISSSPVFNYRRHQRHQVFYTWGLFFPHRRSLEDPSNYTILGLCLAYSSCMSIKYINVQDKNYTSSSVFYILLYLVKRNKLLNFQ